jgi:hypothetical protein
MHEMPAKTSRAAADEHLSQVLDAPLHDIVMKAFLRRHGLRRFS